MENVYTLAEMVREHERLLRGDAGLVWWRAEINGAAKLLKLLAGTSIVSFVVSIIALLDRLTGR